MAGQLDQTVQKLKSAHYTHSHNNINNLRIKYNNKNNLQGLMWYELTDL